MYDILNIFTSFTGYLQKVKHSLRSKILSLILAVSVRVTVCFTMVEMPYSLLFAEEIRQLKQIGNNYTWLNIFHLISTTSICLLEMEHC